MNVDEKIAKEYLESKGLRPVYEPNGHVPPDFSVNNSIGIEVRRLNQNYEDINGYEGLEEVSISLEKMLNNILHEFPRNDELLGYWLGLEYQRPISKISSLKAPIKAALKEFLQKPRDLPAELKVADGITLRVMFPSSETSDLFEVAIFQDNDEGGWVLPLYQAEVERCMHEKALKIANTYSKYKSWWLILVDYLGVLGKSGVSKLFERTEKNNIWEKVLIIDRLGRREAIEI